MKSELRKMIPVAKRVLVESDEIALKLRSIYAAVVCVDDAGSTLDDVREAVTTYEDLERISRRVLGGAHPLTGSIERHRRKARATLLRRARDETSPGSQ